MRWRVLISVLALGACSVPPLDPEGKRCSQDDACPSGYACVEAGADVSTCRRSTDARFSTGGFTPSVGSAGVTQTLPHGLGRTPAALLMWSAGREAGQVGGRSGLAIGATDGVTSLTVAVFDDGDGTTTYSAHGLDTAFLTVLSPQGGVVARAQLVGWDSNGFTLRWDLAPPSSMEIFFLAVGGEGVRAKVQDWSGTTGSGVTTVGGTGFRPDVVFLAHAGEANAAATPGGELGFGVATARASWAIARSRVDHLTSGYWASRAAKEGAVVLDVNSSGGAYKLNSEAQLASFDPDGFSLSFSRAGAQPLHGLSLSLSGVRAHAGTFDKPIAPAAAASVQTGFGPEAVLVASGELASGAGPTFDVLLSMGAASRSAAGAVGVRAQGGTTFTSCVSNEDVVYAEVTRNDIVATLGRVASFDAEGVSFAFAPNDATPIQLFDLALSRIGVP